MEELTFPRFNEESGRMYKENDSLYRRLARHFGLSESAFWILYTLEEFQQPVTQAQLCEYLSLSKQTINSGLKQLEQEGNIHLSSGPGRQLAERTVRPVLRAEERAFLGMAEEERASLLALYRKYLSLLRQESEQIFQQFQEE